MEPRNRQSWIEKTIQDAQKRGLFDNLEGAGAPINWEDESFIDDDWLMAFRVMREQGFAPEWIELHKEIGAGLEKAGESVLQAWQWRQERYPGAAEPRRRYTETEWRRARAGYCETVAELNAKITDFNLIVPITRLQKFRIDALQELADLGIDE